MWPLMLVHICVFILSWPTNASENNSAHFFLGLNFPIAVIHGESSYDRDFFDKDNTDLRSQQRTALTHRCLEPYCNLLSGISLPCQTFVNLFYDVSLCASPRHTSYLLVSFPKHHHDYISLVHCTVRHLPSTVFTDGERTGKITLKWHSATQQGHRRCRSRNRSFVHYDQVKVRWIKWIKSEWMGGFLPGN